MSEKILNLEVRLCPSIEIMNPELPEKVRQSYEAALAKTMPSKSAKKYAEAFVHFDNWRRLNEVSGNFSQEIFMAYFKDLAEKWTPKTLWARYSMIKAIALKDHDVDINGYKKLTRFLSLNSKGYVPKKSKVFVPENLRVFLDSANEVKYLFTKVSFKFYNKK